MLRLGPPYYIIDEVSVMGDAHDPQQFYYMPKAPHLPLAENGKPAIRLLILRDIEDQIAADAAAGTSTGGDDDVAGFLFFDTVTSWPGAVIENVRAKLQTMVEEERAANADPDDDEVVVRLAPLPLRRGAVRLNFLDQISQPGTITDPDDPDPDPTTPVAPVESEWVSFLSAPATPSLYGENRAVFTAELTRKAVKLLYGAFDGMIPASVVYDLEFVGQMQAYRVKVTADWEKVLDYIQRKTSVNLVLAHTSVDKITSELEEHQFIKFESELDSTDAVDPDDLQKEFDDVRKQVQELVLETFFEAVTGPSQEADPKMNGTINSLMQARDLAKMGLPGVGYTRREVDASELKTLDVDFSTRRAVRRRIAPQAHINILFDEWNLTKDDIVTVVDGDDDIWRQTEFQANVVADFARDGIRAVAMDVQYVKPDAFTAEPDPDAPAEAIWSFTFNSGDEIWRRRTWYDPEIGTTLFYRYRIFFEPNGIPGPMATAVTPWTRIDSQIITANTRDVFEREEIVLQPSELFDWDRYPEAVVRLNYNDPLSDWSYEETKILTKASPLFQTTFRQRANDGIEPRYNVTFSRADGEIIPTGWEEVRGALSIIRSPQSNTLRVAFNVVPDPNMSMMLVNARYVDAANGVFEDHNFVVTPQTVSETREWAIPIVDETKRQFDVQQIIFGQDGSVGDTGFISHNATQVMLGTVFAAWLDIKAVFLGPSLASQGVEKAVVTFKYTDPATGEVQNGQVHEVTDSSFDTLITERFRLKDVGARAYAYEVRFVLQSGFVRTTGEIRTSDALLVISSQVPAS